MKESLLYFFGGVVVLALFAGEVFCESEIPADEYKEVQAVIHIALKEKNEPLLALIKSATSDNKISRVEKGEILKMNEMTKIKNMLGKAPVETKH